MSYKGCCWINPFSQIEKMGFCFFWQKKAAYRQEIVTSEPHKLDVGKYGQQFTMQERELEQNTHIATILSHISLNH